ncbi:MAG: hypothetical protein IKI67_06320, partial [Bacteroidales bacterium]|nr:hypothetical protein [Bacteroidales bacterium]
YNPELTKYGYMYAGTKVAKENVPASTVNLEFTPNFTAYEFNLTDNKSASGESMILKGVTIKSEDEETFLAAENLSTYLKFDDNTGAFGFYSGINEVPAKDKSKEIKINFMTASGTNVLPITLPTGGNYLKFTILTLGKTTAKAYQKKIKVIFDMDYIVKNEAAGSGTETIHRVMTLNLRQKSGTDLDVPEGYKVLISNLGMSEGSTILSTDVDNITISSASAEILSTRSVKIQSALKSDPTTLKDWEIVAVVNGQEVAYDTQNWPEWLRLSANESTGSEVEQIVDITCYPGQLDKSKSTITSPAAANFLTALSGAAEIGSENAPRDLSLYDIYGVEYGSATSKVTSITTSGSHTANSYVVSAPGYYCFPLVYGNAIGYTVNNNTDEKLKKTYSTFDNADGNKITSPYILDDNLTLSGDYEAFVLWQDVLPGAEVILNKDISVVEAPAGAGLTCKYIKFRIEKDNILPCNAVIALRDRKNDKILWSWHIWVAPMNQAASDTYYNWNQIYPFTFKSTSDVDINANILNCNLGWCPPINYTGVTQEKCDTLRIKQKGLSSTYKDTIISQESYTVLNKGELFSYTYYQFGRKDPFIGFNGEKDGEGYSVNKPFSSIKKGYDIYGSKIVYPSTYHLNGKVFEVHKTNDWIRYPYIYNKEMYYSLINLWNHSQTTTTRDSECYNYTDKSVYDPSPAGFCVPPSVFGKAFAARAGAENYGTNVYGSKVDKNATLGLPAGALLSNTGSATENHKLFFPQAIQRKGGSGRLIVTELTTIRYWTSSTNKASSSPYYIYAGTFKILMNGTFGLQPVSDQSVYQNQGQPVRPVLEQSH